METRNLELLRSKLEGAGLDAVVAVNKKSVVYLSDAPTAWSDWQQRRADGPSICFVVWPAKGDPVLIVGELEREVTAECAWIPRLECYAEYAETPYEKLGKVLDDLGLRGKRVGIEKRAVGAAYWEALTKAHRDTTFIEAGPLLDSVRAQKTEAEISIFRQACSMLDRVYLSVFSRARPGTTELELHTAMLETADSMGMSDTFGNLLSGDRAMVVHRSPMRRAIKPGDIIRTDYISFWRGRAANLSRVFVVGEPSQEQKTIYRSLREVELEVYEHIKPGLRAFDLWNFYIRRVETRGFKVDLPLLGHNIGTEAHEEPMIAQADTGALESRMVICVEPFFGKQYQIQDQLLITSNGIELLSNGFPTEEMFVVE